MRCATCRKCAWPHPLAPSDWDARYNRADYLFGEEPSGFLVRHADLVRRHDSVLAVADGEGRNGVWLAEQGLAVHAIDGSAVALRKSDALAKRRGVSIRTEVVDVADYVWPRQHYDLVVAIFIQFAAPPLRDIVFKGMVEALKPGASLLLHGYRPEQLGYGTGGPRAEENLYTEAMLRTQFSELSIVSLESYDAEVSEGSGHSGMSALIDLVAVKPE